MIDLAKNYIRESLTSAKNPALLVSFGKDSMLLLEIAREVKPDISLLWFGDKLSSFAESTIKENDLCVYSYAPADRYLVPNADGYSLIDEYSFGKTRVPLVSDLVKSEKCEIENLPTVRTSQFNYPFDLTLWGYRREDSHPLIEAKFPKKFQLGDTVMDAPLWNWSESEVYNALAELRIPFEAETNEIEVCASCLEQIKELVSEDSLTSFQHRFNWRSH